MSIERPDPGRDPRRTQRYPDQAGRRVRRYFALACIAGTWRIKREGGIRPSLNIKLLENFHRFQQSRIFIELVMLKS